ncbi:hypothetical protein PM082_018909 [Marasmius tenuissimus]|nr:hypothetical protein PM082_018909 [Marasmius tenuissimus]
MDPVPYNITLSSQTATISYSPAREGPVNAGWNSTYSAGGRNGPNLPRPQGVGADYHRTSLAGASLELGWDGTAVYLYGKATAGSYRISVDGVDIGASNDVPTGGLLGSKTGLKYGSHTVKLEVLGKGEVAFQYAEATIGVGYPGNDIQNRTVFATIESPTPRPNDLFFQFGGRRGFQTWAVDPQIWSIYHANGSTSQLPRQMHTFEVDASVTFSVNRASAFFLWGVANYDHFPKRASITGHDGQLKETRLDDGSEYLDFDQIIYWQSGLDPDKNYTVQIVNGGNEGDAVAPAFSFNRLELIDGGPSLSPLSDTSTSSTKKPLEAGGIAGIVVGSCIAIVLILGAFLLWRRKTRRKNHTSGDIDDFESPVAYPKHELTSNHNYTQTSGITSPPIRATDAGPTHQMLPPQYQPDWSVPNTSTSQVALVPDPPMGSSGKQRRLPKIMNS